MLLHFASLLFCILPASSFLVHATSFFLSIVPTKYRMWLSVCIFTPLSSLPAHPLFFSTPLLSFSLFPVPLNALSHLLYLLLFRRVCLPSRQRSDSNCFMARSAQRALFSTKNLPQCVLGTDTPEPYPRILPQCVQSTRWAPEPYPRIYPSAPCQHDGRQNFTQCTQSTRWAPELYPQYVRSVQVSARRPPTLMPPGRRARMQTRGNGGRGTRCPSTFVRLPPG